MDTALYPHSPRGEVKQLVTSTSSFSAQRITVFQITEFYFILCTGFTRLERPSPIPKSFLRGTAEPGCQTNLTLPDKFWVWKLIRWKKNINFNQSFQISKNVSLFRYKNCLMVFSIIKLISKNKFRLCRHFGIICIDNIFS